MQTVQKEKDCSPQAQHQHCILMIATFFWSLILFVIIPINISSAQQQSEDKWRLRVFEAALKNDPALCQQDQYCLKHARYYQSLVCIDRVCDGSDKSRTPVECAKAFADKYSKEQQGKINIALCDLIRSPSKATRKAYLSLVVDEGEGEAVELGAYLMAFKGSADACKAYIKSYVGSYGPRWSFQWYRALSGCNILAGKSTWEQEERDFRAWMGVIKGTGRCSDISHRELMRACSARKAASPAPVYEQLW